MPLPDAQNPGGYRRLSAFIRGQFVCSGTDHNLKPNWPPMNADKNRLTSEYVLHAKLNHPFGLGKSKIGSGGDLACLRIVRRRQHRVVELRMVERIEQLRAKLDLVRLSNAEVFVDHQIPLIAAAALNGPFAGISQLTGRRIRKLADVKPPVDRAGAMAEVRVP